MAMKNFVITNICFDLTKHEGKTQRYYFLIA